MTRSSVRHVAVILTIVAAGILTWATQPVPPGSTNPVSWWLPSALVGYLVVVYFSSSDLGVPRLRRFRGRRRRLDFGRVTPGFRAVMDRAEAEVRRLDHRGIGTEHLLLGILGDPESTAGRLLVGAGLEIESARNRLEEAVGRGDEPTPEKMRLTVHGRRAMEIAFDRAGRRGNGAVEDHHLLEGVLAIDDSVGVWLVIDAGISLVEVRRSAAALRRSRGA